MKTTTYIIIFILALSFTYAAEYPREQLIFKVNNCYTIDSVKVSGTEIINNSEYNLKGCEGSDNTWKCPCSEIILQTKLNTINNYSFLINYTTTEEKRSSGGGGGKSYVQINYTPPYTPLINESLYLNTTFIPINDIENTPNDVEQFYATQESLSKEDTQINKSKQELANEITDKNKNKIDKLVWIIAGVFLLFITIYLLIKVRKNKVQEEKED